MDQRPIAKNPVRFGMFLVNFDSGEVFKSGRRLKIQDQPFRVLAALLERPGEVVTREQLQARIWPDEGFGDFDHALRIAIAKLRGAFGDAPEAPRFIETLPRRGYRFIFPIDQSEGVEPSKQLAPAEGASPSPPAAPNIPFPTQASKRTLSRSQWVGAALVLAVALVGLYLFLGRATAQPKVTGTVQITQNSLDITNTITDGFWLYLAESTGSRQILKQVSAAGGPTKEISTPFASIAISDISPDHSEMLVTEAVGTENKSQLWILPLPQGAPRRLADVSASWGAWDPGWAVWTPDGQHIVFADESSIKIVDSNGKNPGTLVQTSGIPMNMSYSPDGRFLRFNASNPRSELHTIWEVRSDGRDLHRLFRQQPNGASDLAGHWSKDGKYYFFTRCDSNGCHVWFRRESRGFLQRGDTSPAQLTSGPTPVFLTGVRADGKGIFVSEWSSRSQIVRYDSVSRQFSPFIQGFTADDLDFSRDGKWMAYVSEGPNRAVWRSRVDGTESRQLTSSGSPATPRWSPDGRQIAYVEQSGTFSKIMMIPAEGGVAKEICSENQDQVDPNWSPDGKKLIYARTTWPRSSSEKFSLKTMDVSSCQISEIPGSENLFSPRWSPDGRRIAAISRDKKDLVLLDVQTGTWSNLTREEGAVIYPAWSADSKYIYFDNISSKNPAYRRIRVGQTTSEAIVDLRSLRRGISSHLGPWSGLAPNNQPLFQQDLSTGEIHFLELALP